MHTFSHPEVARSRPGGFSLVELLVVLAIIAIVASISVPVISSTLRSYKLDTTGQAVVNQLNLARQMALSQGHAVQVRFYQLPDSSAAATASPSVYRGMQCLVESDPVGSSTVTVSTKALTKPIFFPTPIVISSVASPSPVSPLISGTSATTVTAKTADSTNPLPVYQGNYNYVSFHFQPDGSTDLTSDTSSLTLILKQDKVVAGGLPANFQTIVIDPRSGTIRSFRP